MASSVIKAEEDETMRSVASLRQFRAIEPRCGPKRVDLTIDIDATCRVTVDTKKCQGRCRSWTDIMLEPPYYIKHCSCCQAINKKSTHIVKVAKCHNPQDPTVETGRKVSVSVPVDLKCACATCGS